MRVALVTSLAVIMVGCSTASNCDATGPAPCVADRAAASALAGSWMQLEPVNGRSVRMTLSARDTILTGTGTFSATGGPGGATQIAGFVFWRDALASPAGLLPAEPITVLNFTFADGVTARFDQAKLFGQDTLKGALTYSSNESVSYGVSFVRAPGMSR